MIIMAENLYSLARQWWWEICPTQHSESSEPPSLLEVIVPVGQGGGSRGAGLSAALALLGIQFQSTGSMICLILSRLGRNRR